jgi:glycosyltransferase involved in cell wall biosynthesis
MSVPAVSVLMSVYNADRYLDEAVRSILHQSFGDFEFIIIDDGSTDGSLNILRRYEASDSRIRVISRANTGYCKALNEALALARGEFIARMDADDVSAPQRFERQLKFLRANPEVLVLGAAVDLIDGDGRLLLRTPQPISDQEIQKDGLSGHCSIVHSAVMIRRDAMVEAGGYDVDACPSEDLDLWLRLGEHGKLANLPDVLGKYRLHTSSICATNSDKQKIKSQEVSERARTRRGVEGSYVWVEPSRASSDARSQHEFLLKYGWWAFQSAQRSTALLYAWRAIKQMPWRAEGWRLLMCATFKPMTALSKAEG